MIRCNNGDVLVEGSMPVLLSDLSTIVHAMHYDVCNAEGMSYSESRERILKAVELGFKTEEECKHEAVRLTKELLEKVLCDLTKILDGEDDK